MGRGPKKHLKRTAAPRSWMLDKLTGSYAPKASPGPHKSRECIPLIVLLRNKLHYAMNGDEVKKILMRRYVKVDGKVRTDKNFPVGLMDIVQLHETGFNLRILYDTKGRFVTHKVSDEEAKYKLLRVTKVQCGKGGIPYIVTHDGRTIRYPSPDIKVNDSVKFDLVENKIIGHYKFDNGSIAVTTGGHNIGRIGTIIHKERHLGGFDIIHIKDRRGYTFATRLSNVFVIGNDEIAISLPEDLGTHYDIFEERDARVKDDVPESATYSSSAPVTA